ncbi:MAG: hypothetical protein ACI8TQ_000960 [Planctomycetota bacterium]|jgi:hypothetical protein
MRAINVLLSVLISLLIGLLVFEGGLRVIGLGPPNTLNQFDADTGWSKKANHEVTRHLSTGVITLETNALGLRDDPMTSFAKPADTFRVVMLGDSFTLGYTVNREDLFVDILEKHWQAEGRKVEVLNVGTEGWSTDQEVAWLLAHGEEVKPDLVVLLPYDNDVFWCGEEMYTAFPKPVFTADGELESRTFVDQTTGLDRTTAFGRLISPNPTTPTFTTSGGKELPGDFSILLNKAPSILGDAPARAKGALSALKSKCSDLGSALVIAPIPSNASVDADFASEFGSKVFGVGGGEWSADRAIEFFLASAGELGIRTADARASLKTAHAKESCYFDYFEADREWHFNANGNRVFASFLAGQLNDILPAATGKDTSLAMAGVHAGDAGGLPFWLKLYLVLWVALTTLYFVNYRDEAFFLPPIKVGLLLAVVIGTFKLVGFGAAELAAYDPSLAKLLVPVLIAGILIFVAYKMGNRLATIIELIKAFVLRGHWYLMPLVVVLLTIGSLLVVAASSPLVAPFIYTLF